MAKYINADEMIADENEAYLSAQCKITDKVTRDINFVVHTKLQRLLADAPAAEVIERKRGKWIKENGTLKCSECGFGYFPRNYFFMDGVCISAINDEYIFKSCPLCGADMRAERCTE